MYVALSRVTSLSGLFLIDDYSHFLVADPTAAREYEMLKQLKTVTWCRIQHCYIIEYQIL